MPDGSFRKWWDNILVSVDQACRQSVPPVREKIRVYRTKLTDVNAYIIRITVPRARNIVYEDKNKKVWKRLNASTIQTNQREATASMKSLHNENLRLRAKIENLDLQMRILEEKSKKEKQLQVQQEIENRWGSVIMNISADLPLLLTYLDRPDLLQKKLSSYVQIKNSG